MKENSTSVKALLPVLFGFFIMGFCDVVGISTSYVKSDFGLSETIAGFSSFDGFFMVFVACSSCRNVYELVWA